MLGHESFQRIEGPLRRPPSGGAVLVWSLEVLLLGLIRRLGEAGARFHAFVEVGGCHHSGAPVARVEHSRLELHIYQDNLLALVDRMPRERALAPLMRDLALSMVSRQVRQHLLPAWVVSPLREIVDRHLSAPLRRSVDQRSIDLKVKLLHVAQRVQMVCKLYLQVLV